MKAQLSSRSETKVFIKQLLPESQLLIHVFYIAIRTFVLFYNVCNVRSDRWVDLLISWNIHPTREFPQNVRLGKSSSAGSLAAVGLGNMMQNCILDIPTVLEGYHFRPWKWMVGRWGLPFENSLFSGATVKLGEGNCFWWFWDSSQHKIWHQKCVW